MGDVDLRFYSKEAVLIGRRLFLFVRYAVELYVETDPV